MTWDEFQALPVGSRVDFGASQGRTDAEFRKISTGFWRRLYDNRVYGEDEFHHAVKYDHVWRADPLMELIDGLE